MALSAPTLTAPPGFALWSLRRASPKGACPPPLILGAGGGVPPAGGWRKRTSFRCTFRHGGRGTGLVYLPPLPENGQAFCSLPLTKTRPFSCRCKRGAKATHPASPVSRASRYNTLHLASKVVCQGGAVAKGGTLPPFGNPAHINPSINLLYHSLYGLTEATKCDTIRA